MKLLLLSIEFPPGPGGLGTKAYQLAMGLTKLGWNVTVATVQSHADDEDITNFNKSQPYHIVWLKYIGPSILEGIYRLLKIYKLAVNDRPELILAIGRQAAWIGALVAELVHVPLVLVGAGTEFLIKGWLDQRLTSWAFGQARLVIPISKFALDLATRRNIHMSQVKVIQNGADDTIYKPGLDVSELKNRLQINDSRIILTVGQVSERKAQDVVINALPEIVKKYPNIIYLIVGLPTLLDKYELLARKLNVLRHVRFIGVVPQEQLPFYYNLCDVFVMVSRQTARGDVEGFGIVVVEAALCGRPAIVSSQSGLMEAVIPEVTALVVNPDDVHATAQAILKLLEDDDLRLKMGTAAYENASINSTWTKRVQEYHQLLKGLL